MAAAEWRRPWACMAAVNCSSSRELSCRDATSFSASCWRCFKPSSSSRSPGGPGGEPIPGLSCIPLKSSPSAAGRSFSTASPPSPLAPQSGPKVASGDGELDFSSGGGSGVSSFPPASGPSSSNPSEGSSSSSSRPWKSSSCSSGMGSLGPFLRGKKAPEASKVPISSSSSSRHHSGSPSLSSSKPSGPRHLRR